MDNIKRADIISETTKRALEHYGHDLSELETRDPEIGTWPKESAMERLKSLPDFMDFVDDTKKVRITFEYDPDYPTALFLAEVEMKPVQWVPYKSEGEADGETERPDPCAAGAESVDVHTGSNYVGGSYHHLDM